MNLTKKIVLLRGEPLLYIDILCASHTFVHSYEGDPDMMCDFSNPKHPNFDPDSIVQNNILNVTKV